MSNVKSGSVVSDNSKKRGRKPKGAKIMQSEPSTTWKPIETKQNVIVHLKCSINDINEVGDSVEAFQGNSSLLSGNENYLHLKENVNTCHEQTGGNDVKENTNRHEMDLMPVMRLLDYHLHNNNTINKHSACFWCTYDFDTEAVHIPKYLMKGTYYVYANFCCPECAAGYLMQEHIDSSAKYERYYLLNQFYAPLYTSDGTFIKPAPNPFYLLEKYVGNLTIQEYRHLCKSKRLFVLIDKPVSKILPEFHEDNDDYIITNKIIPNKDSARFQKTKLSSVSLHFAKVV